MRELADARLHPALNLLVAGSAGSVSRVAVNGLSVVKIYGLTGVPPGKMGISSCAYQLKKVFGPQTFMRGSFVAAARAFPHYGILFATADRINQQFVRRPNGMCTPESLAFTAAGGAAGGVLATLVTHPADVVKTRLVVQGQRTGSKGHTVWYTGAMDAYSKIIRQEGLFQGLYRGLIPSVIGSAVFWGTSMALWDMADNRPWERRGAQSFVYFEWLVGPAIAVTIASVCSHPFDLFRRKMMAQSFALPAEGGVDIKFRGYLDCAMKVYKYGGVFGFWSGLMSNAMKAAPQVLVFLAVFKSVQTVCLFGSEKKNAQLANG